MRAAGGAVPQPRGAGPPRPAVEVVVRALEDLARGQVVHGEAVEPGKDGMGFELTFMVALGNFGLAGFMKEVGFRDSSSTAHTHTHVKLLKMNEMPNASECQGTALTWQAGDISLTFNLK